MEFCPTDIKATGYPRKQSIQTFLSINMCLIPLKYEVHVLRKAAQKAEMSKTVRSCPSICVRPVVIRVKKEDSALVSIYLHETYRN